MRKLIIAFSTLLLSMSLGGSPATTAEVLTWSKPDVEVDSISFYPKKWKGEARTWVDIVLKNPSSTPHRYRTIVKLGGEPPFAISTKEAVPPGGDVKLTLSTTALGLPGASAISVEVLE